MNRGRLTEIDGLRGLAALAVMVGHWGETVQRLTPSPTTAASLHAVFLDYFSFGRLGIVAFFCVSGFVVPFSFRGARPLIAFPISRFFRLYPAYWLSMLVAIIVYPLVNGPTVTAHEIALNLTMAELALGEAPVIGVYWTLQIELIFYAICYVMFAARLLHGAKANFAMMTLFLGIALAAAAYRWGHPGTSAPVGLPTYLAAMHFGTIARLRTLEDNRDAAKLYPFALAMLAICVLTANTVGYLHTSDKLVGWVASNTGYMVGLGLFLLATERKWFVGRGWAFLGLIGYSTYLLHMVVKQIAIYAWPHFADWRIALLVLTPFFFGGTILAAWAAQRFVERPSIALGRRTERWVEERLFRTSVRPGGTVA
jgi:peptidoglycan/LPS O-acetylase OafA/YrhL